MNFGHHYLLGCLLPANILCCFCDSAGRVSGRHKPWRKESRGFESRQKLKPHLTHPTKHAKTKSRSSAHNGRSRPKSIHDTWNVVALLIGPALFCRHAFATDTVFFCF